MEENIVLIGAGSAVFTRGLLADILRRQWRGSLALVDVDPVALQVARRLAEKMIRAKKSPLKLIAATDRRRVLRGASIVICTIGVGGRRAWEQDVFVPRRFGIYQPVGDTVMPGGTSRALRMIPPMVDVARDVLALCPNALFFNYSNPMAPLCRAIRKATGANVVGLCHGVDHVGRYLAGVLGVPESELKYSAVGINHLTWFVEVRVKGRDALPRLMKISERKLADPTVPDRFTWELTRLFGAFPAVLDRHVTEFFPWLFGRQGRYYGKTLGVESFSFEGTIARGDADFAEMRRVALSRQPLPHDYFRRIGGEHEKVIEIVESIRGDKGAVYSANLPNCGQVSNLPAEAIVESPAVAGATGLRPLVQRPLPSGLVGTLATRYQWVETVVEAALAGSREKFIQALLLDGAVDSIDMARDLADALLKAQAAYLPPGFRAARG